MTANGPGRPLRGSIYHDYYVRVRGTSGLEILLNLCRSPSSSSLSSFSPVTFLRFWTSRGDAAAPDVAIREREAGEGMYEERTKITSEENKGGIQ